MELFIFDFTWSDCCSSWALFLRGSITAAAGPLRTSRRAVVKVLSFWVGIVGERGGLEFPGVYSVLIISGTKGFRLRQFRLSFLSCSRGSLLWCAGLGPLVEGGS